MDAGRVMRKWSLLFPVVMFCVGCGTVAPPNDQWLGQDKAKHFLVGVALGAGSGLMVQESSGSDAEQLFVASVTATGVGAGKEWYDQEIKKTGWSWKDLVWDVLGGLVGGGLVVLTD